VSEFETDFEKWCRENGYNPHTLEASGAYWEQVRKQMSGVTLLPVKPEVCEWREDEDGQWFAECGAAWAFPEGCPVENRMIFCPCCGKKLLPIAYVDPDAWDRSALSPVAPEAIEQRITAIEQKLERLMRDIRPGALRSTTASETVKEMYGLKETEHE